MGIHIDPITTGASEMTNTVSIFMQNQGKIRSMRNIKLLSFYYLSCSINDSLEMWL